MGYLKKGGCASPIHKYQVDQVYPTTCSPADLQPVSHHGLPDSH